MGRKQTILCTISPNSWMLLKKHRYKEGLSSCRIHPMCRPSSVRTCNEWLGRNWKFKTSSLLWEENRINTRWQPEACPVGNVDAGNSGAADEGEMGVVRCKHRLAAATAADCHPGTHAGWHSPILLHCWNCSTNTLLTNCGKAVVQLQWQFLEFWCCTFCIVLDKGCEMQIWYPLQACVSEKTPNQTA